MKVKASQAGQEQDLTKSEFFTNDPSSIEALIDLIGNLICPIGVPLPVWYNETDEAFPESRFVMLDGRWMNIDDAPKLGRIYGPVFGQTATRFKLPDGRSQHLVGKGVNPLGFDGVLGATIGSKGMAHFHGMGAGADLRILASGGSSSNTAANVWTRPGALGSVNFVTPAGTLDTVGPINITAPPHTHASSDIAGRIGTVSGGMDGNTELIPPAIVCNYMTRYK
jgi:hypothetical protein